MTRYEKITAAALVTVLVALLLVGVASGTILRHTVQVGPVLAAILAVVLRPGWSRFAAMPVFAFWLFIMLVIWLYLLGLARVVTGQFSRAEIGLTVVIGLASLLGLVETVRTSLQAAWWLRLAAFVMFAALQAGAMWLSLQPVFATR